ncbi:MAG: helix-turn-helix domain-containing protein [Sulfitobacter sp.]|nr:helix-turn-helix domain-containing protein [Sulfitobacter sp.]
MDIGQRLKQIRTERGLSQRELATRAGLTNGTISLIETDKTSPSVASLKSLLDAIPISMAEFFGAIEEQDSPKFIYRADEFIQLTQDGPGQVALRQLGNARKHTLQVLHETYPAGADTGPEFLAHEGEEAGIITRGQIELTVGDTIGLLNCGDGYLFDSRLPHRFRNIGTEPCEIVSALTPPVF